MIILINKYYAIKRGKGVENKIVRSWEECKSLVEHYPSIYKSFKTEKEALQYLESITDINKKLTSIDKAIKHKKAKKSNTISVANLFKGVRIDNSLADDFISKCEEFNTSKEKMLIELIKDWTY